MALTAGTVLINRYRIARALQQEPGSVLYRAWDLNLNVAVLLKESLDLSALAQQRLAAEINILKGTTCPSLPRVTDQFVVAGQGQYVVMGYIEGDNLETILVQRGAVPGQEAGKRFAHIAEAVSLFHRGSPAPLHGNLRPANIRISADGQAVLLGLQAASAPADGAVSPYAAPEQAATGQADARTDVYALGAMLYWTMTGQTPPKGLPSSSSVSGTAAHIHNTLLDARLEPVIACAMSASPDQRYATAAEFKAALDAVHNPLLRTVRMRRQPHLGLSALTNRAGGCSR